MPCVSHAPAWFTAVQAQAQSTCAGNAEANVSKILCYRPEMSAYVIS